MVISLQVIDDDIAAHSERAISVPAHVTPMKLKDGGPLIELDKATAEAKLANPSCLQATAPWKIIEFCNYWNFIRVSEQFCSLFFVS